MIRFDRGPEPAPLRDTRWVYLARAELAVRAGTKPTFSKYDVVKTDLWHAQNEKCVFCELVCLTPGQPVEHYRPKGKAVRADGTKHGGYWWLAWTWENLLYACVTCNSAFKRDLFPLDDDTRALAPGARPPGEELPLIVDPATEDPMDHIVFVEAQHGRWRPVPRNGSARGKKTIEVLGLDHTSHLTAYANFAKDPKWARLFGAVDAAVASGTLQPIGPAWDQMLREAFYVKAKFHALAHDIIDARYGAAERAAWNIVLPRPGAFTPPPPPTDRDNPALAPLPDELSLRCRALGPRASSSTLRALLTDLCADAPRDTAELAAMVERAEAAVSTHLQHLAGVGSLVPGVAGVYAPP